MRLLAALLLHGVLSVCDSASPPVETPEVLTNEGEAFEHWSGLTKPKSEVVFPPTVVIVILVRNKAHALPNFLAFIDLLNYPKDRISLFIRSDHNVDNSTSILREWLNNVVGFYDKTNVFFNDTQDGYVGEDLMTAWPNKRMATLMRLRQESLDYARSVWADYVFFVDADNLLENPDVLIRLMRYEKNVVAPMLISPMAYSNWWGDMTDKLHYRRSPDYMDILHREKIGLFQVPMIHSTFLVDLRYDKSRFLTYSMDTEACKVEGIPFDDRIVFAFNARRNGIQFWLSNEQPFGKLVQPLDGKYSVEGDKNQFDNMKLESFWNGPAMPISKFITFRPSLKPKVDFDQIYVINWEIEPERLTRLKAWFEELGIRIQSLEAVDGKSLSTKDLASLGIKHLAPVRDRKGGREPIEGEIGGSTSHYKVWEDVVQKGHKQVVVLEDDIRFEKHLKTALSDLIVERRNLGLHGDWELIHLGRRRVTKNPTHDHMWPSYTYGRYSYMLSKSGAQKLLKQRP